MIYWRDYGGKIAESDDSGKIQAMARARAEAFLTTQNLEEAIGVSSIMQLYHIQKYGIWQILPGEYASLQEYLHSVMDNIEKGDNGKYPGRWYDLHFMADELLPVMEESGIDAEKLTHESLRRLRETSSYLRQNFNTLRSNIALAKGAAEKKELEITKKEKKGKPVEEEEKVELQELQAEVEKSEEEANEKYVEYIDRALNVVGNANIPTNCISDELRKMSGQQLILLHGKKMVLPTSDLYLLEIPRNASAHDRAVEIQLKNIVDGWSVVDPYNFVNDVVKTITGKPLAGKTLKEETQVEVYNPDGEYGF